MSRRGFAFATAPTPPLCESPDNTDASYEAYVLRLSVQKLDNKKHINNLKNATLIRSVYHRALQTALSSSLCWENTVNLPPLDASEEAEPSALSLDLDMSDDTHERDAAPALDAPCVSVWDMVDAWESSRKRGEDVLMADAVCCFSVCGLVLSRLCCVGLRPMVLLMLAWKMRSVVVLCLT